MSSTRRSSRPWKRTARMILCLMILRSLTDLWTKAMVSKKVEVESSHIYNVLDCMVPSFTMWG